MIGWIIQITALSLCLIAVVHYLYVFFKTTLTVPKVKDLVNRPQKQYDAIFKEINCKNNDNDIGGLGNSGRANSSTTSIASLPILTAASPAASDTNSAIAMKLELKQFMKGLHVKKI
jgi:hypothetical protein